MKKELVSAHTCGIALLTAGLLAGTAFAGASGTATRHNASSHSLGLGGSAHTSFTNEYPAGGPFQRIASMPVFLNTDVDEEAVAEIVAATEDGMMLVYTDGAGKNIGFVDITDPYNPLPAGIVLLVDEPTSVAVAGDYALAAVNTSEDYINTSGQLDVIDIASQVIIRSIDLGGQPDSVAVSPDGQYAAVVIENERDEDLGDGEPPQLPAGFLVIVDLVGSVDEWTTRQVDLTGICDLFPEDPEPEYVDINSNNIGVVTCQENNHIIMVSMADGQIIDDFSAGTVDLTLVDDNENDLIELDADLFGIPREPDAVTWTSDLTFVTADEGDLYGGSRGFTNFLFNGFPLHQPGNTLEHLVVRLGHYPESRSENKGCEPEGAEFGDYGPWDQYLFVGSERSSVVFVYSLAYPDQVSLIGAEPRLVQILPAGVGPEGLLAIPSRNLFITACEEDSRDDKIRATVGIYMLTNEPNYPTIISANRDNGTPIPWAALSGMDSDGDTVYTIYDSYYRKSRVFSMDATQTPAVITGETMLVDTDDVLLNALMDLKAQLPDTDDFDPEDLINNDKSVNLDPEGVAVDCNGYWIAHEGAGNLENGVSDPDDRPFESPDMLVHLFWDGTIDKVVLPPFDLLINQLRFGFEGVAVTGEANEEVLYVAFQRAWQDAGDPSDRARIGRYDTVTDEWTFAYYTLDDPSSPAGGWVGLSEITFLGDDMFAIVERDNQAGPDATIKRIYTFSIDGVTFMDHAQTPNFEVLNKQLARDILVEGDFDATGGLVLEKVEGLTVLDNGDVLIVNDNDGTDDSNGETQLLNLGRIFD